MWTLSQIPDGASLMLIILLHGTQNEQFDASKTQMIF